jgi:hypothetical protein
MMNPQPSQGWFRFAMRVHEPPAFHVFTVSTGDTGPPGSGPDCEQEYAMFPLSAETAVHE